MNLLGEGMIKIIDESDIVNARKEARIRSTELGFGMTDVTRVVTAVSELARNIYRHGGGGVMRWLYIEEGTMKGIELVFEDRGPGIPDIDKAMEVGYTTGGGMGMGLPGARKLMDNMMIESEPGNGTRVSVKKWLRK